MKTKKGGVTFEWKVCEPSQRGGLQNYAIHQWVADSKQLMKVFITDCVEWNIAGDKEPSHCSSQGFGSCLLCARVWWLHQCLIFCRIVDVFEPSDSTCLSSSVSCKPRWAQDTIQPLQ
jgi:hypothetical protein